MAKAWTGPELKECSLIYSTHGMKEAMASTGRSQASVSSAMIKAGVRCKTRSVDSLKPRVRTWYAEQIAWIFESIEQGVSRSIIAESLNVNLCSINTAINNARKNGFDAYPMRNK